MRVLAILGSPRKQGNTAALLESFLKGARDAGAEIRLIDACETKISPCLECYACADRGICPIQDPMAELYPLLKTYEVVVVASPIFFSGVSAQLKTLIDRCQACWMEKYRLGVRRPKRAGYFLSTGARREFEGAIATIKAFFITLDIEYRGDVLVGGLEEEAIQDHPEALEEAYRLGRQSVS